MSQPMNTPPRYWYNATGSTSTSSSSGEHHSKQERETSHEFLIAIIIGSVTLGLVVILVVSLLIGCCVVRSRRNKKRRKASLGSSEAPEPQRDPGVEEAGGVPGGVGIQGESEMEETRVSFNPLNMVMPRDVITRMNGSQTGSQGTIITNPPPPYGNSSQSGSRGSDLGSPNFAVGGGTDSVVRGSLYPVRPLASSTIQAGGGRVSSSVVDAVPVPSDGRSHISYDFSTMARLFPSPIMVLYTFTPTCRDELEVKSGDKLDILGIFDDGWCLCRTETGKRGVVPLACLDITGSGAGARDTNGVDVNVSGGGEEREQGRESGIRETGSGGEGDEGGRVGIESRNVGIIPNEGGQPNSLPFPRSTSIVRV